MSIGELREMNSNFSKYKLFARKQIDSLGAKNPLSYEIFSKTQTKVTCFQKLVEDDRQLLKHH